MEKDPVIIEIEKELSALVENKQNATNKIQAVTKIALKNMHMYKLIVYAIEKFLAKTPPDYKLYGVYVVDSICQNAKKEKNDKYSAPLRQRFEQKLVEVFVVLSKCRLEDRKKIKKVLNIWKQRQIFSSDFFRALDEKYPEWKEIIVEDEPVASIEDTLKQVQQKQQEKEKQSKAEFDPLAFDYGDDKEEVVFDAEEAPSPILTQFSNDNTSQPPSALPLPSMEQQSQLAALLAMTQGLFPPANGNNPGPIPPVNNIPFMMPGMPQFMMPMFPNTNMPPQAMNPLLVNQMQQPFTIPQNNSLINNNLPNPVITNNFISNSNNIIGKQKRDWEEEERNVKRQKDPRPLQDEFQIQGFLIKFILDWWHVVPEEPDEAAIRRLYTDEQLPTNILRVLSRTLFVGSVHDSIRMEDIIEAFAQYNPESITIQRERKTAFVKVKCRQAAEDAIQSGVYVRGASLPLNWACGFGPKHLFTRDSGFSDLPVDPENYIKSKIHPHDLKWICILAGKKFIHRHTDDYLKRQLISVDDLMVVEGGTGFQNVPGIWFGGVVMEEPWTPIGQSKSSAIELRILEDQSKYGFQQTTSRRH